MNDESKKSGDVDPDVAREALGMPKRVAHPEDRAWYLPTVRRVRMAFMGALIGLLYIALASPEDAWTLRTIFLGH